MFIFQYSYQYQIIGKRSAKMATLNFPKMVSDSDKSLENYIKGFDRVLSGQKKISNDFKSLQKNVIIDVKQP